MLDHPTLAAAAIQQGRIRETNGPWRAQFALPPDVSLESHVATLFPNPVSADRFERALQAELASAGVRLTARLEHMLMRRDGSAFLAEIVVRLFAMEDAEHPLSGDAVWQVRDITVERTLRRELRDLEDYHRELSRHQSDLTFVIDRKGRISYASASIETALGYRVHAMLGEPFVALLAPDHAAAGEEWLRASTRQSASGGDDGFALHALHDDGSVRVLSCRTRDCFAIPRIGGLVVYARDVTATWRDDAERAAEQRDVEALRERLHALAASPEADGEPTVLLAALCDGLGVALAALWAVPDDAPATIVAIARRGIDDDVVPPAPCGRATTDTGRPLVANSVRDAAGLEAAVRASLAMAGVDALVEVPVPALGRARHVLAVGAIEARNWRTGEVDFMIGIALLLAARLRRGVAHDGALAGAASADDGPRDPLTGLANRQAAEREIDRCAHGGIVLVGLDGLADINAAEGLAGGDAALVSTANTLVELAGADGFVARVSGDEFVLLMPEGSSSEAEAMAERIRGRLGRIDGARIEASVAIVPPASDAEEASTQLVRANHALREAKNRGGAQTVVYSQRLAADLRLRSSLDVELEDAVARNEFVLFYQPQIALATGKVVGLEALLRWQHPERGLLLPDAFIATAIERGLIDAITKSVLLQVCEQIAAWRRSGDLPELPVTVNVSGRQFHDRRLPALVASALLKSGLPARLLVLELTEQNVDLADGSIERVAKELLRLGVRIATSDFSIGHASFRYQKRLQVSQIKLEHGFVAGLPGDVESTIVATALVDIAQRLKYRVIAAGVETREQFEALRAMGCETGQGFYFGAPLSAPEIRAYLEANRANPIR